MVSKRTEARAAAALPDACCGKTEGDMKRFADLLMPPSDEL